MNYPWHTALVERVSGLLNAGALPHSLALTSSPGWGHHELLRTVSLLLLETTTEQPLAEFAHPDFRYVGADGTEIKVDAIRAVNEFAVTRPQMAPRKVIVVDSAELMNTAASNALLKTLEEPVANTHIVLATERWNRLLPTVRSRCQRFQVDEQHNLAHQWLSEQGLTVTQDAFALAGYAPMHMLREDSALDNFDGWLVSVDDQPVAAVVKTINASDPVIFIELWYRRLVHLQGGADLPRAVLLQLHRFADQLLSVRRQLTTSNAANVNLLAESLTENWCRLLRAHPEVLRGALAG